MKVSRNFWWDVEFASELVLKDYHEVESTLFTTRISPNRIGAQSGAATSKSILESNAEYETGKVTSEHHISHFIEIYLHLSMVLGGGGNSIKL